MHLIRCFWCSRNVEFKAKDDCPKMCPHCNRPLSMNLEEHMERVKIIEEKEKKSRLGDIS